MSFILNSAKNQQQRELKITEQKTKNKSFYELKRPVKRFKKNLSEIKTEFKNELKDELKDENDKNKSEKSLEENRKDDEMGEMSFDDILNNI